VSSRTESDDQSAAAATVARVQALIERGLERYGNGDLVGAVNEWEHALTLDPGALRAREYIEYVQANFAMLDAELRLARGDLLGDAVDEEAYDSLELGASPPDGDDTFLGWDLDELVTTPISVISPPARVQAEESATEPLPDPPLPPPLTPDVVERVADHTATAARRLPDPEQADPLAPGTPARADDFSGIFDALDAMGQPSQRLSTITMLPDEPQPDAGAVDDAAAGGGDDDDEYAVVLESESESESESSQALALEDEAEPLVDQLAATPPHGSPTIPPPAQTEAEPRPEERAATTPFDLPAPPAWATPEELPLGPPGQVTGEGSPRGIWRDAALAGLDLGDPPGQLADDPATGGPTRGGDELPTMERSTWVGRADAAATGAAAGEASGQAGEAAAPAALHDTFDNDFDDLPMTAERLSGPRTMPLPLREVSAESPTAPHAPNVIVDPDLAPVQQTSRLRADGGESEVPEEVTTARDSSSRPHMDPMLDLGGAPVAELGLVEAMDAGPQPQASILAGLELPAELTIDLPSSAPSSEVSSEVLVLGMWARAVQLMGDGDAAAAAATADDAMDRGAAGEALARNEAPALCRLFELALVDLRQIPLLAMPLAHIATKELDHRAGFLLSRIDGLLSFDDIVDVSGMSRLDALRLLSRLVRLGFIEVR
jgi:hypothetical protein